jgi:hypothetical protein
MTWLVVTVLVLVLCYGLGKFKHRNDMRRNARRQLKYNDVYAEEAAKKEARKKREHDTGH